MNFRVLIHEDDIKKRVQELGDQISDYYKKKKTESLIVIGVLKGGFVFLSDLVRALHLPCEVDFVEASSYGAGTESSGEVKLLRDVSVLIKGKDVLVVEDIVDTGYTLSYLLKHLGTHEPKSLSICSFLDKPSKRKTPVEVKFLGFTIEDHFVVGYGLDYNNRFREIKSVVIFDPGQPH